MNVTTETKLGTIMRYAPARELVQREFSSLPKSPYIEMLRMLSLRDLTNMLGVPAAEVERLIAALADVPEPAPRDVLVSIDEAYEGTEVAAGSARPTIPASTPLWGVFEVVLAGPSHGNPYVAVRLGASFTCGDLAVEVLGFYDGDGVYRVRFMPEFEGEWHFVTSSNARSLAGIAGSFTCTSAPPGAHGPVRVAGTFHFAHADGTPFRPIGTTVYGLTHQSDVLEAQTFATLAAAPFNKVRMCVFPKWYPFNMVEPQYHAYALHDDGTLDVARFNPEFFHHLEQRLRELAESGIEADLILFHPYDKWGYSDMPPSADDLYLRYVVARLGAFANVWWSLANEYDFMYDKTLPDWQRFGEIVSAADPHHHLLGVHNGLQVYDHSLPWVTHCSIQSQAGSEPEAVATLRDRWNKPVMIDECCYEGDIEFGFGNLTGEDMTRRFWEATLRGGYATHGECFLDPDDVLWWGKGGALHGTSPARIAFLRAVIESAPGPLDPVLSRRGYATAGAGKGWYLTYNSNRQPARRTLEVPAGDYRVELLDTWNMTIEDLGVHRGEAEVEIPARPYLALRMTTVD